MSLPKSIIWLSFSILLWFAAFYDSILNAFGIWMDSATYNHCLFVTPVAVYLISQKASALLESPIKPSFLALFLVIGLMLLWGLGFAGKINVFQHAAAFSILPLIIVSSIGLKSARIIWFPLLFMLFSIPVGEELIPLFQQITADLSVQMLLWSGVPIFREGLFIQVPGGKFLVAEACSGIRFFVSTVMLGTLCAYIFFSSTKKRLLFIVFSIVLPIVANAIRAYGIMLVGYLSGMEHAVGADHLIYGWVFFALVTGLLIFTGNFFKDEEKITTDKQKASFDGDWNTYPFKKFMIFFVVVFLSFLTWKSMITKSLESTMQADTSNLAVIFGEPQARSKYISSAVWRPIFNKADISFEANAKYPNNDIDFHYYAFTGANNAELISWENRIFDPEIWTLSGSKNIDLSVAETDLTYTVLELFSNTGQSKTVAYWYQVPGLVSSNKLQIQIRQAINVLIGKGHGGVFISVSIDGINKAERIREWLQENYLPLTQAYISSEHLQDTQPTVLQ